MFGKRCIIPRRISDPNNRNKKGIRIMNHLYLQNGSVNPALLYHPTIIWGCGNDGRRLCQLLKKQKAEIFAFCDSNRDLWNKQILGFPVISCEEAFKKDNMNLALAFHQWINVIDEIKTKVAGEMFADYLFEMEERGGGIQRAVCGSQELTGSNAHFAPFLVERMFNRTEVRTRLIHCKNCGLWFSLYRPNDLEMGRLYSGYRGNEYVKQRKKYEPQYSLQLYVDLDNEENRKRKLAKFLQNWIDFSSIHMLLDYGGDEGQYIPQQFQEAEKYVYEISGNIVRDGVILLNDIKEVTNRTFDFIMCCHVLEHISNPMEIIEIMTKSLNSGGYLYIEVPNENFFRAYSNVEINEHINFFFKETMEFIAVEMNLNIVDIEVDDVCRTLLQRK